MIIIHIGIKEYFTKLNKGIKESKVIMQTKINFVTVLYYSKPIKKVRIL